MPDCGIFSQFRRWFDKNIFFKYSMEYKPLDLNKFCSASFMGLSVVDI